MQILKDVEVKNLKKEQCLQQKNKRKNNNVFWIIKISLLAFCLSLILGLFSEIILNKLNLLSAFIILIIFMALNIFSDMLGLAITSCQMDSLKEGEMDKKLYKKCLKLIKNSDRVSSVLCDVVGDVSGILCGISGTIISIILTKHFSYISINIFWGILTTAVVAALTVLFKAITKKYAVENSLKLLKFSAKILLSIKNSTNIIFRKNK